MATVIDSFLVALGFRVDPSGANELKRQTDTAKSQLLSLGTAVKAFATGYVVKSVVDINSAFEQNRIQIAGFLSALGLSSDFNRGLEDASDIIAQITKDAAKLPGEAEEYVEVFKANAAYLKTAMPGSDAGQIANFTNRMTAVAKTVASTMDAGQIARESGMLLAAEGRAGTHNVLWQKLMPFLMQVDGQSKITAQSFNAMTQPKRVELLNKAFDKLQPALDAASDTFDAMWGAAVSGVRQFIRAATPGLFQALKDGIASITGFFINDAGKLTANGKAIADVLKDIGYVVVRLLRGWGVLISMWYRFISGSFAAKLALAALVAGFIGLQNVLKFGLLGAIALIAEDLYTFYTGGESVTGLLVEKFAPALELIKGLLVLLAAAFVVTQAASLSAAIETAVAWTLANAPIILMIIALGVLIATIAAVISKWEEFKATWKSVPDIVTAKIKDALGVAAPEGSFSNESAARLRQGAAYDAIAYKKSGFLAPGAIGPGYNPLAGGPAGDTRTALGPYLQGTPDQNGQSWDRPAFDRGGTRVEKPTVIQNINAADARGVESAAERGAVRGLQKAYR